MTKNRMILIYTVFSLMLVGSAVVLAKQVRHFMNEREDLTIPFQKRVINPEVVQDRIKQEEEANQRDILLTFSQTRSFRELATPVPMPTPTPIPPNTPTPIIPARGWMIDFLTKQYAFLIAPDKSSVTAKLGEKIANRFGGEFIIMEIIPDMDFPRVKVKDVSSGIVGEINQMAAPGK